MDQFFILKILKCATKKDLECVCPVCFIHELYFNLAAALIFLLLWGVEEEKFI